MPLGTLGSWTAASPFSSLLCQGDSCFRATWKTWIIPTMAELYGGYAPSNVARDAKYSIKRDLDDGVMKVHLVYRSGHRERALLSTDLHRPLVEKVNKVKRELQGVEGGVFYINEWGHV